MGDSEPEVRQHNRIVFRYASMMAYSSIHYAERIQSPGLQYVKQMAHETVHLAERHDLEKLEPFAKKIWDHFTPHLKVPFGSPAYLARVQEIKATGVLDRHILETEHHPEKYKDGIGGMNIMQLTEYLADNWERCKSVGDGNLRRSLEINRVRHKIDPQTMSILVNTAIYFGWIKADTP